MAAIKKTRSGKFVPVTKTTDTKSGPSLEQVAKGFGIEAPKPDKKNIRAEVIRDRLKAKQQPRA